MSESAEALYRDLVVERARRPLHAGEVEAADGAADGTNPLCGDTVHVTLRLDGGRHVSNIRHRTRGCAICSAAADLMAETVGGLGLDEVELQLRRFEQLLQLGEPALDPATRERLGTLLAFADLHEYKSRRKCAMLPWSALVAAFRSGEER